MVQSRLTPTNPIGRPPPPPTEQAQRDRRFQQPLTNRTTRTSPQRHSDAEPQHGCDVMAVRGPARVGALCACMARNARRRCFVGWGGGGCVRGGTHLDGDWGAVPSATVHDTELAFTEDSAQGEFVRGDLPVGVVDVLECRGHVGGEGAERSRLGRQQQRLVLKDPGTSLHAWCALQTITYGGEEG